MRLVKLPFITEKHGCRVRLLLSSQMGWNNLVWYEVSVCNGYGKKAKKTIGIAVSRLESGLEQEPSQLGS
jgi:hypothetical protein